MYTSSRRPTAHTKERPASDAGRSCHRSMVGLPSLVIRIGNPMTYSANYLVLADPDRPARAQAVPGSRLRVRDQTVDEGRMRHLAEHDCHEDLLNFLCSLRTRPRPRWPGSRLS